MARYVRVRGPDGVEQGTLDGGRIALGGGAQVTPLDAGSMQLPEPYELLTPLAAPEIWCAGVTYERSRDARVEESAVKDVYTMVYDAAPTGAFHEGRRNAPNRRTRTADRHP